MKIKLRVLNDGRILLDNLSEDVRVLSNYTTSDGDNRPRGEEAQSFSVSQKLHRERFSTSEYVVREFTDEVTTPPLSERDEVALKVGRIILDNHEKMLKAEREIAIHKEAASAIERNAKLDLDAATAEGTEAVESFYSNKR